jgi:imidazolonepropionase-like amidohydrolase
MLKWIAFCGSVVLLLLYQLQTIESQTNERQSVILFEGARLIIGDGSGPIVDSAFLVQNGTVSKVGRKGRVIAPAGAQRIDLAGKTVMPTLIDAHGHPGFQRGLTYAADNFTRETIVDDLNRALYFGVAAVQSQGIEKGDVTYQIRADQEAGTLGGARLHIAGRGIGAPNAGPGAAAYQGIAYEITTEEEARNAVRELAARKVNLVKVWVDDRNGRAPRLAPNLFSAVIDEGHKHGLQVNAHVFYYTDASELVNAGIDALVHLVRDKEMDDALVSAIVKRHVYVMPNLAGEWNTYAELPHWLQDGDPLMTLLKASAPEPVIARMKKTFGPRGAAALDRARTQYAILERSLARLARANANIVLGPDTGLEDHLFGMSAHRELESMVRAGMTPMQVIVAATSRSAEYLKLTTMGTLATAKEADFLVLDANPLDDITNTQRISRVYVKGTEVDRAALARTLKP